MDEELYYTPNPFDLRVGYRFQWCKGTTVSNEGEIEEDWKNCIIEFTWDFYELGKDMDNCKIRTKYLTVEDIISLGWEDEGQVVPQDAVVSDKPVNLRRFTKGKYGMIYDFIARVVMIYISVGDVFSVCVQRYNSPSINELAYILLSLNLQHI